MIPLNLEPRIQRPNALIAVKRRRVRGPLIRKIDCLQIPVPDLEQGLSFYRDRLGHRLIWKTSTSAGLGLPDTDAEIVISTERKELEPNLLVESVDRAVDEIEDAGGEYPSQTV